jgi:hypothetical protein
MAGSEHRPVEVADAGNVDRMVASDHNRKRTRGEDRSDPCLDVDVAPERAAADRLLLSMSTIRNTRSPFYGEGLSPEP